MHGFNKNVWLIWIALLLLGLLFGAATELNQDKQGKAVYAFDCLTFKAAKGEKALLEVFSEIYARGFEFRQYEHGYYANYDLSIGLFDAEGDIENRETVIDSFKVDSLGSNASLPARLIRTAFYVDPGKYEARIRIVDLETLEVFRFKKQVPVPDYSRGQLKMSDLQLATSINMTDESEKNMFVKNGRKVVPNVKRMVTPQMKGLYVYSEVYNLEFEPGKANQKFATKYTITDSQGLEVKTIKEKNKKPGNSAVLGAGIPIDGLKEGQYQLTLVVKDPADRETTRRSVNFYVVKAESES
ncbi:hypothetical protein GWO43_00185 [candidate division KSB1 bacterium]|nr:hypothetical protein [candidate division KSB1 bacterium]NIR68487.1 hypothetical protein [candidate division KSB1 bacterium]NIS22501.1 hypothetical protein [candidate division KSB1 bacterium]NIT69345.1 hypothetical protein [candidate division KSB1 bacterium]NIU23006.1 hypothetical protein [candidate division KSB1 bacterium]